MANSTGRGGAHTVQPAHTDDSFANLLRTRLRPLGEHARYRGALFTAGPWVIIAAVLTWLILMARQLPCRQTSIYNPINTFYRMCYSDIGVLYQTRHLSHPIVSPYGLEYPVLTGWLIDVGRTLSALMGAPMGPQVAGQAALNGANIFSLVTAVLLFGFFLIACLAQVGAVPTRPFDALMVAAAPTVMAAGLINWDMLCVALCSLAVWAWSAKRPAMAGAFIGLGVAAKLYPGLLLIPLAVLCLRSHKLREYAITVGSAVLAWLIPNSALYLRSPGDWAYFYTFNVDRGGDFGSIWYVMSLAGIKIPNVNLVNAVLLILGTALICALGLLAPRRPRLGQLAFLLIALFLILNKVYSPQYVVWLLPFVVLARPRWTDYAVWTVAELAYFAAIWGHISQTMLPVGSNQDKIYWAAVLLRVGAQAWLMALVVRDILRPNEDIVRLDGADDPSGGVLDGAPDAPWLAQLQNVILGRPSLPSPTPTPSGQTASRDSSEWKRPSLIPRLAWKESSVSSTTSTVQCRISGSPGQLLLRGWLTSRLLFGLVLVVLMIATGRTFLECVGNWDVEHFLRLSRVGYQTKTDPAFFPGLPLVLAAGARLGIPGDVMGVLLSLFCSALAGLALLRLGIIWHETGYRRRGTRSRANAMRGERLGLWAAIAWFVAPTAVFTAVPYTEALFCACAFWAWERAYRRRWLAMGVLAGLACTVRVSGLFLVGALAVLLLTGGVNAASTSRGRRRTLSVRDICLGCAALLIPIVVLLGYAYFQWTRTGDWMAWYHAQTEGWARGFAWPWESFKNTLPATEASGYYAEKGWTWIFRAEVASMFIGLGTTIVCLCQRRWGEASWVFVHCLAFSLSYWWMSVNRAVLLWFPLWLLLGQIATLPVSPRWRTILRVGCGAYLAASTTIAVLWAVQFFTGGWSS